MLQSHSLEFSYDGKRVFRFPDVHCANAQSILILGKSGIGKSTFLHLLAGILKPSGGSIMLDGERYSDLSASVLDRFRGKNIGIVFQKPHFIQALNVNENLSLSQKLGGNEPNQKTISKILNRLKIGHRSEALPNELSEGELQRASIARAVINQPKLILADEPTSALDDENTHEVVLLLKEMADLLQSALVIVTHDERLKKEIDHQILLT